MFTILTKKYFQKRVLEASTPVLIAFGAEWCGPFHMLAPILEQLQQDFLGQIEILGVDIDACPQVATEYGIQDIPTLVFFKNGEVVDQISGVAPKQILAAKLRALLHC